MIALACAVCSADEINKAFQWSTLVLSLLPLAMIGGIAFWLYRASKKARAAPSISPPAE